MKRDYKLYIQDIIDSISLIQWYLQNINEEQFIKDVKLQDAVIRRLEIIGEASRNIPLSLKVKNKEIPWAKISLYRDFIVHSYFSASLQRIWEVAKKEMIPLKESFQKIKLV